MAVNADSSLTIRVNKEVKAQAQQLFSELGLDMSTAINVFLRMAINRRGLPFDVAVEETNEETKEAIREVAAMKADPLLGKTYDDVDQMMEELLG